MFSPVGNQTVIDTILEDLEADDRTSEVSMSMNERFAGTFEEYAGEPPFSEPTLSIEGTSGEDEKFGVVGALTQLIDRGEVDKDLVVIVGDSLISLDVGGFVDFFYEKNGPRLATCDVGDKEHAEVYGLAELDDDHVINSQEKPEDPKSTLVSIAYCAVPAGDLPKFDEYLSSDNNPDEPGWFIQWFQQTGDLFVYMFDEAWFDIGMPQSYFNTVGWYLDSENFVHESATLTSTEVNINVHVMADAMVEDSVLEEFMMFPDAVIRNAELKNSIVDEGTRIESLDLSNALIGVHSWLTSRQ